MSAGEAGRHVAGLLIFYRYFPGGPKHKTNLTNVSGRLCCFLASLLVLTNTYREMCQDLKQQVHEQETSLNKSCSQFFVTCVLRNNILRDVTCSSQACQKWQCIMYNQKRSSSRRSSQGFLVVLVKLLFFICFCHIWHLGGSDSIKNTPTGCGSDLWGVAVICLQFWEFWKTSQNQ